MKLIIDIPDKVYNEYREGVMSMENNCIIGNAVLDGIPYEPKDEWISVSERLPEESDFYLITIADKYTTYVNTLFFMKSTADMWEHDKRVIAWQPLPKPYESEADNG